MCASEGVCAAAAGVSRDMWDRRRTGFDLVPHATSAQPGFAVPAFSFGEFYVKRSDRKSVV